MKSPCKDCPDRAVRCRLSCEKWREYEIERNEEYKKRWAIADGAGYRAEKQNKIIHRQYRAKRR